MTTKKQAEAARLVTVYHPTLPAEREVPASEVEAWAEQGWRKSKPAN